MTGNLGYLIEGHAGIVGDVDIARPKLPKLDVQAGSLPDRFSGLRQPIRCSLSAATGKNELGFDRPHSVQRVRAIENLEHERW